MQLQGLVRRVLDSELLVHVGLETGRESGEHAASAGDHQLAREGFFVVYRTATQSLEQNLADSIAHLVIAGFIGIEQDFRCLESLASHKDLAAIRQSVGGILTGGLVGQTVVSLQVSRDETEFLLDLPHLFEIGRGVEVVAPHLEQFDESGRDVSSSDVHPFHLVLQDGPLYHRH